jgi:aryl-alcohol dehydrogenase-like predicted oxidoreductase
MILPTARSRRPAMPIAPLPSRHLGSSAIDVGTLVLGGNVFGWTIDQAQSFAVLDAALAAGVRAIDTADLYSRWKPGNQGGESETIIGNWLAQGGGRRDRVQILTKVGMDLGEGRKGLARAYILASAEASLKRLKTDRIDLYQSHIDDPTVPLDETLAAYDQLIRQGKVRAIGASNYNAARLALALETARARQLPAYCCLQPHYNLLERADYEAALEPLCRRENLGVIPYFSLASGFLTGKYRAPADFAKSPRGGGMAKHLNPRGLRILAALDAVAARTRTSPTAVALAWLIARPGITAPIASATTPAQIDDLLAGARLVLDAAAVAELTQASAA